MVLPPPTVISRPHRTTEVTHTKERIQHPTNLVDNLHSSPATATSLEDQLAMSKADADTKPTNIVHSNINNRELPMSMPNKSPSSSDLKHFNTDLLLHTMELEEGVKSH